MFGKYKEKNLCKDKKKSYEYMVGKYGDFVDELVSNPTEGIKQDNVPIWIFWWQGEDSAPELIRRCIKSVRKNAGKHPVKIIDSTNYSEFVRLPKHIQDKFSSKKISITHFSDYYRMALLAEHGGLWLDASIFAQRKFNMKIFENPLFTVRNPGNDLINISEWNWTVGVVGGWQGNTLFCAVRDLISAYWKENDYLVDYFLFDYLVKIVYEQCAMVKKMILSIEPNNENFYFWQNNVNAPMDENVYQKELSSSTWLYKLSWKGNYSLKTEDGRETFYSRWLQDTDI